MPPGSNGVHTGVTRLGRLPNATRPDPLDALCRRSAPAPLKSALASPDNRLVPAAPRWIGTPLRTIRNPAPVDKHGFVDPAVEW